MVEPSGTVRLQPDPIYRTLMPSQNFDAAKIRAVELLPGFIALYISGTPYIVSSYYRSLRPLVDRLADAGAQVRRAVGGNWVVPWLPAAAVVAAIAISASGSYWWAFAGSILLVGVAVGALYAALIGSRSLRRDS